MTNRKEIEQRLGESLEEFLRMEYIKNHRSSVKIAEKLNINPGSVCRWLKEYNIKTRTISEARLPAGFKKPTKEWLVEEYINRRKSAVKIAEKLNINLGSVCRWLKEYNIKTRTISESGLPIGFKKPTKEWLFEEYINENKSIAKIAKGLRVSNNTIYRLLKNYNIQTRSKANIYDNKLTRKNLIDKLLKSTRKQPEGLIPNDFNQRGIKDDGYSCNGILGWYRRKHKKLKGNELIDILLKDLYSIERKSEKKSRIKSILLKNPDYIIKQAVRVMKDYGFKIFPSQHKLSELGYFSLSIAISRHHGGFPAFREILNQRLGIKSEKQQLENLLDGYINE